MADVIDDDRGQLLLVAGLVIAITFVLLVLVLNTVIYTENLGTRSNDVGGDDAIAYERAAVDHTAALLPYQVEDPAIDAEAEFAAELDRWAGWSREHTLAERDHADVSVEEGNTTGTQIRHTNSSREFTDAGGATDWTLATGVEHTPEFYIRDLPVDTTTELTNVFAVLSAERFRVVITDDAGNEWWLEIYEDEDADGNPIVVAETNSGNRCEIQDSNTTIDLVAGTVDGCAGGIDPFTETVAGTYSIEYENAGNVEGQYGLFVDIDVAREANAESGAYNDPAASDPPESPYTTPAVYYVTIDITYENDRLTYESSVRVSPEGRHE